MSSKSTSDAELRTYGVRWYLLSVVSIHCCLQNAVWAEFPPIAQSAKLVYDWSDSDINMTLNYGNIGAIVLLLPVTWIVYAKGMRHAMVLSTLLTAFGTAFKSLPVNTHINSWLIPIGLFLNGCAGAVTSVGATVLSESWFPPTQRTTATVFYLVSAAVGGSLVFIVGPAVVPEPVVRCGNVTWTTKKNLNCSAQNKTYINFQEVKDRLALLNYTECGFAVILFLFVLFYFPNKPEHPPSITAKTQRLGLWEGVKTAATQWRFWHLALCMAIPTAVYGVWITTADVVLHPFGIHQTEAGWMSFSGSMGGILLGLVLSRLSDVLHRKMKTIMMVIFGMATLFYLLFILMLKKVIHDEQCNMWPNWAVFVTSLLSVLVLYVFREEYRRLDIDLPIDQSDLTIDQSDFPIHQSDLPIHQSDLSLNQSEYRRF
ncbi:solute carrier family 49 member 4 homolog isoform X2 [Ostrea edulis]|uniref:solute carrier family 49 member 4 homolog isoform X2 n=1 Tax=Ostrea edulis TaxID=37623 RepID=UPI0024AFB26F|nr:solute carrier family 49 member 4 homolog isoform X2 [Ostrea edulis]